jgi:hypothetical protein
MTIKQLSGDGIYNAFLSGASEVISQRIELDRINVFPVPDGDTGSNLAFTMYTIAEQSKPEASVKKTMESIAEAAINGARGNSGIIFAQYVNGLYMEMEDSENISIESFAKTALSAVEYAYKAISNPVEGTMITVIREWAESLKNIKEKSSDYAELFTMSLETAAESLRRTPEKLKVLRDSHVVDSGAKGFVHFLEGFLKFVKTMEIVSFDFAGGDATLRHEDIHAGDHLDLNGRYCTEALIKGKDIDTEKIRESLADLGSSFIIAGNNHKARLHLHTDRPEEVFRRLKGFGTILQQKADDMVRQFEATHDRTYPIALVTDSIADLPREFMDRYKIHMVPLNLISEGSSYLDKVTISPEYFYKMMDDIAEYPTSSQPGLKETEGLLRFLSDNYEKIIAVTVSGKMSGTHSTFMKAAAKLGLGDDRIAIIDSKRNSGAEGLVVMKAAEDIHNGLSFDEVLYNLEENIKKSEIFVSVTDLKYMVRSGRIGKVAGFAANAMNFKPVVSIDGEGKGTIIGKAFSVEGNTVKIHSLVSEIQEQKGIERYAIVHANAPDRAKDYESYMLHLTGKQPEYIMDISTIVAMSAGIGTVAVALISN